MGDRRHGLPFNVNDTSNATFTAIAAVSSKALRVQKFGVSIETADTITIKNDTTTIWGPLYLGATANGFLDIDPNLLKTSPGNALKITKGTASTKVTVYGIYNED